MASLVDEAIALSGPELTDAGRPALVHGDVWDGILMVERGDAGSRIAGLLDPKLEFADVELELAYRNRLGARTSREVGTTPPSVRRRAPCRLASGGRTMKP